MMFKKLEHMIKQLIIHDNLLLAFSIFCDIFYWPVPKFCSIAMGGLNVFNVFAE